MYFIVGGPLNGKFVTRDVPMFRHAVLSNIARVTEPRDNDDEIEEMEYVKTPVHLGRQVIYFYRAGHIHPDTAANFFFEEVAKVWNRHLMGKQIHKIG